MWPSSVTSGHITKDFIMSQKPLQILFTIGREWNQHRHSWITERVLKVWHICTMEFCSCVRKNESAKFRWMDETGKWLYRVRQPRSRRSPCLRDHTFHSSVCLTPGYSWKPWNWEGGRTAFKKGRQWSIGERNVEKEIWWLRALSREGMRGWGMRTGGGVTETKSEWKSHSLVCSSTAHKRSK